jgi:hypothetical protein
MVIIKPTADQAKLFQEVTDTVQLKESGSKLTMASQSFH